MSLIIKFIQRMKAKKYLKKYLKLLPTTPWATRTFVLSVIFFHCLDFWFDKWSYNHLSSNFTDTILNYEFWRLAINFVYEPNIIVVIFIIIHFLTHIALIERLSGTVVMFYEIITIGFLTNLFTLYFEGVIFVVKDNGFLTSWKGEFDVGAGGVLINILLKLSWFNKKQLNKFFKILCLVLYPNLIIIIGSCFSGQVRIDMIIGYIFGWVQCLIFNGGILFYSPDTYTKKQYVVNLLRLNKIPFCFYININLEKIKANQLGVVESSQFYDVFSSISTQANQQTYQKIIIDKNSFPRAHKLGSQDISQESQGQKWELTQTVAQFD